MDAWHLGNPFVLGPPWNCTGVDSLASPQTTALLQGCRQQPWDDTSVNVSRFWTTPESRPWQTAWDCARGGNVSHRPTPSPSASPPSVGPHQGLHPGYSRRFKVGRTPSIGVHSQDPLSRLSRCLPFREPVARAVCASVWEPRQQAHRHGKRGHPCKRRVTGQVPSHMRRWCVTASPAKG